MLAARVRALAVALLLGAAAARAAESDRATNTFSSFLLPAPAKARVVIVEDPQATEAYKPQPGVIRRMVDAGITNLAQRGSVEAAWRTFVSTQDVVGIKVLSSPGPQSGTRPAVAEAVVASLLSAGHPASQIIIWDKHLLPLRQAGYVDLGARLGVRVAASADAGYDTNHFYDNALLGQLVHGDLDFDERREPMGRKSYVSRLVTQQMTKIINLTPLLNHNLSGVSGNLASLSLGSVDNTIRFTGDAEKLALAVPEIYALPVLGDRVVLNIVDALIAQFYGEERTLLHYSTVLNQLRFSTDALALDVLSVQELELQRRRSDMPAVRPNSLLYRNAGLVEIGVGDPRNIIIELVK